MEVHQVICTTEVLQGHNLSAGLFIKFHGQPTTLYRLSVEMNESMYLSGREEEQQGQGQGG